MAAAQAAPPRRASRVGRLSLRHGRASTAYPAGDERCGHCHFSTCHITSCHIAPRALASPRALAIPHVLRHALGLPPLRDSCRRVSSLRLDEPLRTAATVRSRPGHLAASEVGHEAIEQLLRPRRTLCAPVEHERRLERVRGRARRRDMCIGASNRQRIYLRSEESASASATLPG